ncbi:hypothetical protein PshuTeo2_35810 [Pseudomonas hunanensis]|uniref:hypothetical protein n=1 Tax=Pseudomonas hunanensis TaxID=1247546 RepID=UPI002AA0C64F|nr:hypothetical protein [Pseudomonas hunanensis]MDY7073451.1 hypothetical protein [Pseudomonas hunanensis]HDS0956504.1 hypothetical protein [Pseudomonas putida]
MKDGDKARSDLPSVLKQSITAHPGYPDFAAWCESQLIHPYPIYFLIWQASRESLRIRNPFELIMGDPDGPWAHEVAEKSLRAQGLKVIG